LQIVGGSPLRVPLVPTTPNRFANVFPEVHQRRKEPKHVAHERQWNILFPSFEDARPSTSWDPNAQAHYYPPAPEPAAAAAGAEVPAVPLSPDANNEAPMVVVIPNAPPDANPQPQPDNDAMSSDEELEPELPMVPIDAMQNVDSDEEVQIGGAERAAVSTTLHIFCAKLTRLIRVAVQCRNAVFL